MVILATDARQPPDRNLLYDIYCDESSRTRHRYIAMGGVIVQTVLVGQIDARIAQLRLPELPSGEMKWGAVSRAKLGAYQRL